jgi:hypothetical protein
MIKKIIYSFILITLSLITLVIIYLSFVGLETSKFNKIVINKIEEIDPNIQLSIEVIKIKLDLEKIQLHFSTVKPKMVYQNIKIPITEISIYSKISSVLKSKNEINQAIVLFQNFNTKDVQKLAVRIKPSNFKTYLLNNLNNGSIEKILIDVKFDKDLNIVDYKVNGSLKKINVKILENLTIQDVSLNFISDKNLTLINSVNANYQGVAITNGSLSLKKNKEIEIEGKFNSQFNFNDSEINNLFSKFSLSFLEKNKVSAQGSLLHKFMLKIDQNFKLIDYEYKSNGNILESKIVLKNPFKIDLIENPINKISISKTDLEINLNNKNKNLLKFNGLYNLGGLENKTFKVTHDLNKKTPKFLIDLDLSENIFLELINFKTNYKKRSNIKSEFSLINNNIFFKNINFTEGKNSIYIKDLKLNKKKEIEFISDINVLTFNKNRENNNFKIIFKEKISVTGKKYDATYLLKQLSKDNKVNLFRNITKDVEIKLNNLITKSKIPLNNFILIGRINKGKFEKLSAKSEFSKSKYLDISLKKDKNNKKKLEIYSDLPQALLSNYKFFEGIKGGKLLYNSVFDETGSVSNISIENFKVLKAPAFATLLTLADLGGIADVLSGEGMTFHSLEIKLKEDSAETTIEEILALGPSVSVHMDGYIAKKSGLISLSGTLVPAKMLNSIISKIPVVGNILVGKKTGEGIFGFSFKIKGPPGKVKTTVNPVKTLTPRFITRALDKMKKNN